MRGPEGGASFAARHPRTSAFAALCALTLSSQLLSADRNLYGDAAHYWAIAGSFDTGDGFSLNGYGDRLRGYALPLLLNGVQHAARSLDLDPLTLFRLVSAVSGAALFAAVLPSFLGRVFGVRPVTPVAAATFGVLCFAYWRGHLLYPLSDMPALLFLVLGLLNLPDGRGRWPPGRALIAGACLALAANIRPINEAALAGAAVLVAWMVVRAMPSRRAIVAAAVFSIGVALVALPQASINARTLGTRNPFAHPAMSPMAPNLYLQQLVWGVSIQRYETNIGGTFPVAAIFTDPRGQALLGLDPRYDPRNSAHEAQLAVSRYLRLVVASPLFFASAYARHLVNGLDVAYSTPYVTRLAPRSLPFALVNLLVLSLAAAYGLPRLRRIRLADDWRRLWLAGVFALPAGLAVPIAVESRFFLPLWMLAYGFVVFGLFRESRDLLRPRWLLWPAAVLVGVCVLVASATYAHIQGAPASFETWCVRCFD